MSITPTRYTGQDVAVQFTTRTPAGAAASLPTIKFHVRSPAGAVTVYTLGVDTAVSTVTAGTIYQLLFDLTTAGVWRVRAEGIDGTSAVVVVSEVEIYATKSMVI